MSILDFVFRRQRQRQRQKKEPISPCPECQADLAGIGICIEENPVDGFVRYVCHECLHESFWDFDLPAPTLLRDFERPNPVNEDHLDYRFICYCSQCRKLQFGVYPESMRIRLGNPAPICRKCRMENERHEFLERAVKAIEAMVAAEVNVDDLEMYIFGSGEE